MPSFTVDDHCIKCGLCAELCPARIITFVKGQNPWVETHKEERCIRCGQCLSFCPASACYWDFQPAEDRVPVQADLMPGPEAAETLLRSRRSVRRYKDEPVTDELVLRILETARYSPTASNLQPVRWIVIRSRNKMKELGDLVAELFKRLGAEAPADDERAQHLAAVGAAWDKGHHDPIFRGAPQLAVAVVDKSVSYPEDAAMALTYFELAAHANHIGCCWGGYFTMAARQTPAIQKVLGVNDHELIVGAQMFGYPRGLKLCRILPPRKKINLTWL